MVLRYTGKSRLFLSAAAIALAATFQADAALAQEADAGGEQPAAEEDIVIVVTGSRLSRQRAIERKREAISITDAVSADDVGQLPDFNTAEAVQRLPGVSTQIDQGEARYAVIRGVDPNLNNITIDGNLAGAPEAEGRRVSLDTIPSDLVAAIEVVKAVTPDLDANAVGGNINIVTPTAFDQPGRLLRFNVRGSWNERADEFGYGGSATFGNRFGPDDQFGIVVAGSYNRRRFETDLFEAVDWSEFDDGIVAPESVRYFDYNIMRERIGGILNLDWHPNDELSIYVRTLYSEFTDEEARDQFEFDYQRGDETINSPTSISHDEGRATREFRQNNQTQKIYNIAPGLEWTRGDVTWALGYTYSYAEEITPERNDVEFRSGSNIANTIDLSGPRVVFSDLSPNAFDTDNYELRRIFFRTEEIEETLNSVNTDFTIDTDFGNTPVKIQFGAKYVDRSKDRDSRRPRFDPENDLLLTDFAAPGPADWFDGLYEFGPAIDYGRIISFFNANPGEFEIDEETVVERDFNVDYTFDESIMAFYAMSTFEFGDLTVIGGARVEMTDADYGAFAVLDADDDGELELEDIRPLSGKNSYTDILPGLHLTYEFAPDLQFRAAWTNTIGRPNYDQSVPVFEAEDGEGAAGNPNLEPFKAMALDGSLEYYPDSDTIFSLGVFYKKIENPIFNRTTFDTTFNGVDLDELTRPENADSGWLLGVEANVIYRFAFLPEPLDGFGVSLNGTYVKSEVDVFGREDENLPFFRQSDWIVNAALFYEKGPFEARVALSYRDDYLEAVGSNADEDLYWQARSQWDAKVSYNITDDIQLFSSISNFSDAPRLEYQGIRARRAAEERYSYTVNFGIGANF